MTTDTEIKQQVREFYDQVGWQQVSEGMFQNARYEDLRPVSREYIHKCHLRLMRHLTESGRFLLDAGSGPIQYPEYLRYSQGYQYRVCADISIVALREARQRIGEHGLFVVADVANLPFRTDVFSGVVSLHTLHHLPQQEQLQAYQGIYRVLQPGHSAVVVNGWSGTNLYRLLHVPNRWLKRIRRGLKRRFGTTPEHKPSSPLAPRKPRGTFVHKYDKAWVEQELSPFMPVEVRVWRSIDPGLMRFYIHSWLAGRYILRALYWLEERFPHFMGEHGRYPLMIIHKDGESSVLAPDSSAAQAGAHV